MRAALRNNYCSAGDLRVGEAPVPVPAKDEILVRVHATTVNRTDCAILTGQPLVMRLFTGLTRPRNPVTGTDVAGVVEAAGCDIKGFAIGDRVLGFCDEGLGTHAEYVTLGKRGAYSKMPEGIDFSTAAASIEGAHYASNFIRRLKLDSSMCALINGASGAIGSALLQMLKSKGLTVTAVTGTHAVERVRRLGADRVIDYQTSDFTAGGERYDLVFDSVGKMTIGTCWRLLKPRGVYISSELGPWWQNVIFSILTSVSWGRRVRFPFPTDISRSLEYVRTLTESEQFSPLIDRSYPLERISEAFEYVQTGEKIGNVIVTYD